MNSSQESILVELGSIASRPCVSVYLPKFLGKKACKESVISFKNVRKEIAQSIQQEYGEEILQRVMGPLDHVAQDLSFWKGQFFGTALFSAPGFFKVLHAKGNFDADACVADRFRIKPLIVDFQGLERYYVLDLNLKQVRLFHGDRNGLTPVIIPDSLTGLDGFSEARHHERHVSVVSSARGFQAAGRRGGVIFHNYNDLDSKKKIDIERYFGAVDAAIRKIVGGAPVCPVILAALPEHQSAFRAHSKLTELVKEGMRHITDNKSVGEISREAEKIMQPYYKNFYIKSAADYVDAKEVGIASDRLHTIGRALYQGRVKKLIIEKGRKVGGRLEPVGGRIYFGDSRDPTVNDLLDEFASVTAMNSGAIVVMPRENMPTTTGAAAIFKY